MTTIVCLIFGATVFGIILVVVQISPSRRSREARGDEDAGIQRSAEPYYSMTNAEMVSLPMAIKIRLPVLKMAAPSIGYLPAKYLQVAPCVFSDADRAGIDPATRDGDVAAGEGIHLCDSGQTDSTKSA